MKYWTMLIIFVVLLGFSFLVWRNRFTIFLQLEHQWRQRKMPAVSNVNDINANTDHQFVSKTDGRSKSTQINLPVDASLILPTEFNLAVPFTSQAPLADWSEPFEEACEEASIIMADAFYQQKKLNDKAATTQKILDLEKWEEDNLEKWQDTNAEEVAKILKERYEYNSEVIENPSWEKIKKQLVQGNLVIVPAAGRLLGNRYFRQPGPLYHMLVIRGWTKDGLIITNDPGTKRGENYLYKPSVLMNAIHDWNNGNVISGRKAVIIIQPY